ncbi:MAG: hypothetical protein LPH21_14780 [Shewanella sp.]|nr:hypothetical protein [Shewanella sp.]
MLFVSRLGLNCKRGTRARIDLTAKLNARSGALLSPPVAFICSDKRMFFELKEPPGSVTAVGGKGIYGNCSGLEPSGVIYGEFSRTGHQHLIINLEGTSGTLTVRGKLFAEVTAHAQIGEPFGNIVVSSKAFNSYKWNLHGLNGTVQAELIVKRKVESSLVEKTGIIHGSARHSHVLSMNFDEPPGILYCPAKPPASIEALWLRGFIKNIGRGMN